MRKSRELPCPLPPITGFIEDIVMHLGELISRFDDEGVVLETLARLDDLPLLVPGDGTGRAE
jgi:calcineurin-like phosphoesterase family protein